MLTNSAKVAEMASKRQKTRYDLRVPHSNLQKGDIPVYVLTPEHRCSRKVTVHINMLLPILSLPTKEIVREHTPPKPKRSKENDSSENSTQEMEKGKC